MEGYCFEKKTPEKLASERPRIGYTLIQLVPIWTVISVINSVFLVVTAKLFSYVSMDPSRYPTFIIVALSRASGELHSQTGLLADFSEYATAWAGNIKLMVALWVLAVFGFFILILVIYFAAKTLGGKGDFNKTFSAVGRIQAAGYGLFLVPILFFVAFAPLAGLLFGSLATAEGLYRISILALIVGGLSIGIWSLYLAMNAVKAIHKISKWSAFFAVFIVPLIVNICFGILTRQLIKPFL